MKTQTLIATASFIMLLSAGAARGQDNLIVNGSFDQPGNPLAGWNTDYAWDSNEQYADNKSRVTVVPSEGGRTGVCRIESTSDAGTKLESMAIPFEEGYRYQCTLKFKGPDYRIYLAGYRWKPGISPHDNPTRSELRQVYKSNAETGKASNWSTVTLEIPGKKMTSGMASFLKQIKFLTVYVYVTRTGYIDEVTVTRTRDPSMMLGK